MRLITIRTNPPNALIYVDEQEVGRGSVDYRFVFHSPREIFRVSATLPGYKEAIETYTLNREQTEIILELKKDTRRINVMVEPAPAVIKLDGEPLSPDRVSALTREIDLGVDERNVPIQRVLTAERENFIPARRTISALDRDLAYTLTLERLRKNIVVTTEPPGADVYLDGDKVGISPATVPEVSFLVDLETDQFIPRELRAVKPGYEDATVSISWDGGQINYPISLPAREKEVRLYIDPPGATVTIDGEQVANDTLGVTVRTLRFPPINERGDLKSYTVVVSKKTDQAEWIPRTFTLAWEEGRTDYRVGLEEMTTIVVKQLAPELRRGARGWEIAPRWADTVAMRDPAEPVGRDQPRQITQLARGTQIDSLAISPDGSRVAFVVLTAADSGPLRSQLFSQRINGDAGTSDLTDGQSLDLTPAFTPSGDRIVFASNRQGGTMQLWTLSLSDAAGLTRLTNDSMQHLWPTLDSDPRPRLFWQGMSDERAEPLVYFSPLAQVIPSELLTSAATEPRISPRNDLIVFCKVDPATGKRDLYRMTDRGTEVQNLTNTPDVDERHPAWSHDGRRIVFTADREKDEQGRQNDDIWMLDLSAPDKPVQLTANGSVDDHPAFDAFGTSVYFRSNRGGQWAIWRVVIR